MINPSSTAKRSAGGSSTKFALPSPHVAETCGKLPAAMPVALPACTVAAELAYGAVDWFLYDAQREPSTQRSAVTRAHH